MMNCPQCKATLPDGVALCQFCGATFAPTVPARNTESSTPDYSVPYKWIWPAYYAIAGWWILNGIINIVQTLLSKNPTEFGNLVVLIIGAIGALVGIGLIFRVEQARGIVNIVCFLQIIGGIGDFIFGFFAGGLLGALYTLLALVQIALAVVMIFVLGETEARAADI